MSDHLVPMTIDGEQVEMPLSEVVKGFNTGAAATKRFEEAKALRQEADNALTLARHIQDDPGMTMRVLAAQQGLTVEQFLNLTPAQQQAAAMQEPEPPQFDNPLERQLWEERQARTQLEQRIDAFEQSQVEQRADAALQAALSTLRQQGATDDDLKAAVMQARDMGAGIQALPMIYQSQQYQKLQAKAEGRTAAEAAQAAQAQAREQAATAASQAVSSGVGAVGTQAPTPPQEFTSVREAALAAFDVHGVPGT